MNKSGKQLVKIVNIARLYYEQKKTQAEIAKIYRISRPLVSKILNDAKNMGIVTVEVRSPIKQGNVLLTKLQSYFNIKHATIISNRSEDINKNYAIVNACLNMIRKIKPRHMGLGWGYINGLIASEMEKNEHIKTSIKTIIPLVGNCSVSDRCYHTNELVRITAKYTRAKPIYLYAQAIAESEADLALIHQLENYKSVYNHWDNIDLAVINICNYPSVLDCAYVSSYGSQLAQNKPVGNFLLYYYSLNGDIIHIDANCAVQIPLEMLKKCKTIIGLCSDKVKPLTLLGALQSDIFTHLVATEELIELTLAFKD